MTPQTTKAVDQIERFLKEMSAIRRRMGRIVPPAPPVAPPQPAPALIVAPVSPMQHILKNRQTLRAAIILGEILGPPRCLANAKPRQ